jgi:hypothetical protein
MAPLVGPGRVRAAAAPLMSGHSWHPSSTKLTSTARKGKGTLPARSCAGAKEERPRAHVGGLRRRDKERALRGVLGSNSPRIPGKGQRDGVFHEQWLDTR